MNYQKPEEQLSELFGSYKAEWLKSKIFGLFSKPEYFPELEASQPCMLIGGRGTGKTTVLRCLSYEGQFALSVNNVEKIDEWPYYGIYYRINTNRVSAFKGPEVSDEKWKKLFAHYFNLVICDQLLRLLEWYYRHKPLASQLDSMAFVKIAKSLNVANVETLKELADGIDNLRIEFEAYINNIATQEQPALSMQSAPIDTLVDALVKLPQFDRKTFFFLIDEYENLQEYQQQVVNTLIKHSGQHYTFKIGVRELGLRCRTTLNENEQLISPADYVRINILEKLSGNAFNKFALSVCNMRVNQLTMNEKVTIQDISQFLPSLSIDKEAEKLGIDEEVEKLGIKDIANSLIDESSEILSPLFLYFLKSWADTQEMSFEDVISDYKSNIAKWNTRFENYKYTLLFDIKRGKSGIRKYYSGWKVFVKIAAENIRYLLELVDQSLLLNIREGNDLSKPISPEIQTRAAQNTGKKNLAELEGLDVHGAKLTKLLLSLGRIFEVMASDGSGHTPETNQFYIEEDKEISEEGKQEVDDLLRAAIMHLALVRVSGTKYTDEADTKDYDYMIHPIFSPFFVFSHRSKRKMKLTMSQLLGLVKTHKKSIKQVLSQQNRDFDYEEQLPDQLQLFKGYYHESP